MSRVIFWSPKARSDYLSQLRYIARKSPQNALLVEGRVEKTVLHLASTPGGHSGRVPGTFEKYIAKTSLIIVDELPDLETLALLRLIHTSRQWPEGQWPTE